jgi:hypothetical protein
MFSTHYHKERRWSAIMGARCSKNGDQTITHSVVRKAVHRLDEVVCIASVQWSGDIAASQETDQEYENMDQ